MINIPNLPVGLECYKIGMAKADEYEIIGHEIVQGPRLDSTSQVIVRPISGYALKPAFDIRAYRQIFRVVKSLDKPTTGKMTLTFTVDNEEDKATVAAAIEKLKELPGYVGMETE